MSDLRSLVDDLRCEIQELGQNKERKQRQLAALADQGTIYDLYKRIEKDLASTYGENLHGVGLTVESTRDAVIRIKINAEWRGPAGTKPPRSALFAEPVEFSWGRLSPFSEDLDIPTSIFGEWSMRREFWVIAKKS